MIINLRVIPNAKRNLIKEEGARLKVYLNAPAKKGLANKQLLELLSERFQVGKNRIHIIKGEKSREKIVEILSVDFLNKL
ncbi:MAG: DUF167 domain-containing protein [Candidatus Omnitrophota bacterium]|nr:DUF167 domain-containing protein [Candidatus Omnitrophota bacterium]